MQVANVKIAQLNTWDWFDTHDDPHTRDTVLTRPQYNARVKKLTRLIADELKAPDILALTEIENDRVMRDLIKNPTLKKFGYEYVLSTGADTRGIRNAVMYRPDRVALTGVEHLDPETHRKLMPPEDSRASRQLFARPALVTNFKVFADVAKGAVGKGSSSKGSAVDDARAGAEFTLITNHFKSKIGGAASVPKQNAQAAFIGGYVDALRCANPDQPVIVVGDLNVTEKECAFSRITHRADGSQRMLNMLESIPKDERYSYIYRKEKYLLDHLLVTPDLADAVKGVNILHINGDNDPNESRYDAKTLVGTSDHSPVTATVELPIGNKKA